MNDTWHLIPGVPILVNYFLITVRGESVCYKKVLTRKQQAHSDAESSRFTYKGLCEEWVLTSDSQLG